MRAARLAGALLLLVLLAAQSGHDRIPPTRELEDMTLMETMGVDGSPAGGVRVTASTGSDVRGERTAGAGPVVLAAEGESISGACRAMQEEGTAWLFYGHVEQLLLGESRTEAGLEDVLSYVLRDVEMRLETELYLIKDAEAETAIRAAAAEGSAAVRLAALEGAGGVRRTVKEVLSELSRDGCTCVPALGLEGTERRMMPAGYALVRDGTVAAWAEGDAARGIQLLTGRADSMVVETETGAGVPVSLRVVGARSRVEPVCAEGRVKSLRLTCRLEANLAEGRCRLDDPGVRRALEGELTRWGERQLHGALSAQREAGADCLGLARRAGLRAPWRWSELERMGDPAAAAVEIRVESRVARSYDAH